MLEPDDARRQSQKMEALGRLAGGVAHDFNNLLTAINGYADLLVNLMPKADPNRELAEEIRKAGEKGAALTRQLLAFSRKQKAEVKAQDLRPILQDLEKLLTRLLPESVRLEFEPSPLPQVARVDRSLIEQAILNLVVNARDASPQGGTIKVSLATSAIEAWPEKAPLKPPLGQYVLAHVSDTGIGMNSEVMDHLFEPFFTTKGRGRGTGLGLSTVYGIMQQLDGAILVESEAGKGSRFTLCLPHADSADATLTDNADLEAPRGRGERIALVEKDDTLRRLTRRILQQAGYAVVELSDQQSIAAASGFDGAVLAIRSQGNGLTDIQSASGQLAFDLIEQGHARTVVMLGHFSTEEKGQVTRASADGKVHWLAKPFRNADLLLALRQGLDAEMSRR